MSREFNNAARQSFLTGFPQLAPQFTAQPRGPAPYAAPGETAFAWSPRPSLTVWIMLVPSLKGYNEFTIELGWSRLGRYPQLSMRPSLPFPTPDRAEWERHEYLCRLGSLTPRAPDWWTVVPAGPGIEGPDEALLRAQRMTAKLTKAEAAALAQPLITEALEALRGYGLPYLQSWADHVPADEGPAGASY